MKKILVLVLCVAGMYTHSSFAQNVMNPNDPVVTYNPATPPATPPDGQIAPWVRTVRTTWNTDKFKAYYYNGMVYRIRFPNGYDINDASKKYPMILFLHGGGESAGIYDNEYQLFLEAEKFQTMIDNGQWNGFLLFPQCASNQLWDYFHFDRLNTILDVLRTSYNLDPDRVITTGLSMGGLGSIRYSAINPKYSAVAIGSSPALIQTMSDEMLNNLVQIPVWVANGGTDTNPDYGIVENFVNNVTARGGSVRHSFFPNDGHFVWDFIYDNPDILTYFTTAHKANPVVYNGKNQYVAGAPINSKLGITPGFAEYQWQRNNVDIPGANSNEYTANQLGSYRARFRRVAGGAWSDWSLAPAVITLKDVPAGPGNVNGLAYKYYEGNWTSLPDFSTLTPLKTGVSPNIDVSVRNAGRDDYYGFLWEGRITIPTSGQYTFELASDDGSKFYFNSYYSPTGVATINNDGSHGDVPGIGKVLNLNAGTYPMALTYFESWGGENIKLYWTGPGITRQPVPNSAFSSTGIPVDVTPPTAPTNLQVTSKGTDFVSLSWAPSSDDVGVTRYDILENGVSKFTTTGTVYNIQGLTPNTAYTYAVKAADATGNLSAASSSVSVTTDAANTVDVTAPTVPAGLQVSGKGSSFVNLSWTASTDNVGVTRYDVFENGTSKYSVAGTAISITGLTPSTSYTYAVRAVDAAGNLSALSSAVSVVTDQATTNAPGLGYKYYEGDWNVLPNFSTLSPIKTGTSPNIDLSMRNVDDYFGVVWEGYINIPAPGNYTFELASDDGSKFYFNSFYNFSAVALVNNDGAHGDFPTVANTINIAAAGGYPIALAYFEKWGGQNMQLYWTGPNIPRQLVPSTAFSQNPPAADLQAPSIPTGLAVTSTGTSFLNLDWDNSTDNVSVVRYDIYENGVLKYTSTSSNYLVTGLTPNTTYSYAVRAADQAGNVSALSTAISPKTSGSGTTSGLNYRYFEGDWDAVPNFNTLTPVKTGTSANIDLSVRRIDDYFGIVWEGYINIPTAGTYTFEIASDDGSKFYWNTLYNPAAAPLINNDGLHGDVPGVSATVPGLSAGAYPISLAYFEKWGGENMVLYWSGPGIPKQLVPNSAFSSGAAAVNSVSAGSLVGSASLANDQANIGANINKLKITEAYPNPFVDKFTVQYTNTVGNKKVDVQIFDLNGKLLAVKYFGTLPAGTSYLKMDVNGRLAPKSIYIAKVNVDGVPMKLMKLVRSSK